MNCPICNLPIIQPIGHPQAPILVITEKPTDDDMLSGKPFSGEYARVLYAEMAKAGYDLWQCRLTTLWLHEPVKEGSGKKADHSHSLWHKNQAVMESLGRTAVLCLGTDVTEFFLGHNSTEISGIVMTSPLISAPLVMGTRSPLDVMGGTLGEFSLGIKKFVQAYKKQLAKEMQNV